MLSSHPNLRKERLVRRPTTLLLTVLATSSLVLAACGDDGDDAASTETESGSDHDGSGHGDASPVAEGAREIEVTARSFEFEPDEITVTAGEDIAIVLTSEDLLHDFTIDELDVHVAADPDDEPAAGGLRADEPGEYTFYCRVAGHRAAGMEGTLVVEDA